MVRKTIQIKDLNAGQQYAVQMRALGDGEAFTSSNWSLTLQFTTDEDTQPPAQVQNVDVKCVAAAFRATWSELALDGDLTTLDDLKDYKVVWKETSNTGNQFVQYTELNRATLTYEQNVEELGGVEDITVDVYGRDYAHNVSTTAGTDSVTNGPPGTFTGLTASNDQTDSQAIAVEWPQPTPAATPDPDGADNGDDISYYGVHRDSSADPVADISFTPGPSRWIDPDPLPGEHTYYVVAHDVYGNTIQSNSDTATPIYDTLGGDTIAPAAPSNLVLTPGAPVDSRDGTEAFIDVQFEAPVTNEDSSDYKDNEGFIIRWRVAGGTDYFDRYEADVRTDGTTAKTVTARINDLVAGTEYEVSVAAFDTSNNVSVFTTATATTAKDTTAPLQPSAPSASNDVQSVLVSHNLTLALGGDIEDDVVHLEVYADKSTGFTPTTANKLGTMEVVPGVAPVQKFSLPSSETSTNSGTPETWYLVVKSVDAAGNVSPQSPEVESTPDLISGANILNATIDDAKINTLSATKLLANTAFVNDLNIQNNMTVNNDGFLHSDNWDGTDFGNSSTTGWWMGDSGVVINGGTIEASAFAIIEHNLMPYPYSLFVNWKRWYRDNIWITSGDTANEININAWNRYGFQSLQWIPSTNGHRIYLGETDTDYNVNIEPSGRYVYSVYVNNVGTGSATVQPVIKDSDGVESLGDNFNIPAGEIKRVYFDYTATATATALAVGLQNNSGGAADVALDGVQVEQVSDTAAGVPSIYQMPSGTVISGNSVTTGFISSQNYVAGTSGFKIDLLGDVEFRDGLFRGEIIADSGAINGNLSVGGQLRVMIDSDRLDGGGNEDPWVLGIGRGISRGDFGEQIAGISFDADNYSSNHWYVFTEAGTGDVGEIRFRVGDNDDYIEWTSGTNVLKISGELQAATGTFAGELSAATGSFSGNITGGSINIGSNFSVDASGNMTATNGVFDGNITGGTIDIGGSDASSFHVNSAGDMWLGQGTYSGAPFRVHRSGGMVATSATITGTINATSGSIGGFTIASNKLSGGAIEGASILGGSFRTADSGSVVLIDSSSANLVRFYTGGPTGTQRGFVGHFTNSSAMRLKSSNGYSLALNGDTGGVDITTTNNDIDLGIFHSGSMDTRLLLDYSFDQLRVWLGGNEELTLGTTGFLLPNVYNTNTGGGSTVYVDSDGRLHRNTSSLKNKTEVTKATTPSLLSVDPIKYRLTEGNIKFPENQRPSENFLLGFGAEHVVSAIPEAAVYDGEGELVDYQDRAVLAALLNDLKNLYLRVEELESRLESERN